MPKISLRAARVNCGMTQAVAAQKIGISVSTLKNWEAGRTFPNKPMIDKICDLYGISFDALNFC